MSLPVLLDSFDKIGVPDHQIVAVIGDSENGTLPEDVLRYIGQKRVYFVPYNAIDLNALAFVSEHDVIHTPWIFAMHDTVRAGPQFYVKACDIYKNTVYPSEKNVWQLLDCLSMSMGFVRTSWLKTIDFSDVKLIKPSEEEFRNLKSWIEDDPFHKTDNKGYLSKYGNQEDLGYFRYAGTTFNRKHEYYSVMDMHKFKSWYGQSPIPVHTGLPLCQPA
jgi:hypothetical protein